MDFINPKVAIAKEYSEIAVLNIGNSLIPKALTEVTQRHLIGPCLSPVPQLKELAVLHSKILVGEDEDKKEFSKTKRSMWALINEYSG